MSATFLKTQQQQSMPFKDSTDLVLRFILFDLLYTGWIRMLLSICLEMLFVTDILQADVSVTRDTLW